MEAVNHHCCAGERRVPKIFPAHHLAIMREVRETPWCGPAGLRHKTETIESNTP